MADPVISITIASYERPDYLKRVLDSIKIQEFRDFEVIITDDSKSDIIKSFVQDYDANFPLFYHKNIPSLGTAKNMLEGMKYARAQWIKIIHDDDFFSSKNALEPLISALSADKKFIFSGYNEYNENTKTYINRTINKAQFEDWLDSPSLFFAKNVIGPPTVMMIHKGTTEVFDSKLKWFTDMEYYFCFVTRENTVYVDIPLVNVSYNDTQVTNYTRTNATIVIPEAIYLLNKHGKKITSNMLAYDSWWRVFRNMQIRSINDVKKYTGEKHIPKVVKKMIAHQKLIPGKLLKIGVISKISMATSYMLNKLSRLI